MSSYKEYFPNSPPQIRPQLNEILRKLCKSDEGSQTAYHLRMGYTLLSEEQDPVRRSERERLFEEDKLRAAEIIGWDNLNILLRGFAADVDPDVFEAK